MAFCSTIADAQVADVASPQHSARIASLGGAGVAARGYPENRSLNPALLVSDTRLGAHVGYSRTATSDVVSMRGGAFALVRRLGTVSVDVQQRHVERLIDDPALSHESGLEVSDLSLTIGVARSIFYERLAFGLNAVRHSSTVFGTQGSGWAMRLGTALEVTPALTVGAVFSGLGSRYRWKTSYGHEWGVPLQRSVVVGFRWAALQKDALALSLVMDGESGLGDAASNAWRAGGEVGIVSRLLLRAGYEMRQADDRGWERTAAAGIGLRFSNVSIDLARDGLGLEVGERTLIEIAIRR